MKTFKTDPENIVLGGKYYIRMNGKICACKVTKRTVVFTGANFTTAFDVRYVSLQVAGIGKAVIHSNTLPKDFPYLYKSAEDCKNDVNRHFLKSLNHSVMFRRMHIDGYEANRAGLTAVADWRWDGYKAVPDSLDTKTPIAEYDYDTDTYKMLPPRKNHYWTQDCCEAENSVAVVDFDDDEDDEDFAEAKRDEFREYVRHHCPDFEDDIDWEYFENLKSMPQNLATQVKMWCGK